MYGIRHLQNAFKQFPSSYHPPIYLIYLIDDDKKRGEKNVEKYLDLVNQQRKKVESLKKLIKDRFNTDIVFHRSGEIQMRSQHLA